MTGDLLVVEHLDVVYSLKTSHHQVLGEVDLSCGAAEIVSVIGRSGIGKTTLLRAIAGLIPYSNGRILFEGDEIQGPSKERSLVFQDYPVFPWLKVVENVEFGLRGQQELDHKERRQKALQVVEAMGLADWANHYPAVLSGGMRQRVALARSLVASPKVLLLDEPFGALDAITKLEIQGILRRIQGERRQAVVLVTHNVEEAVTLSDSVGVLAGQPARMAKILKIPNPRSSWRTSGLDPEQREIVKELLRIMAEANER